MSWLMILLLVIGIILFVFSFIGAWAADELDVFLFTIVIAAIGGFVLWVIIQP